MTYELAFRARALKEWKKLAPHIRDQFAAKLRERLESPRNASARLSGLPDCYKIKLRSSGYRLVYQVLDSEVLVVVVAVGRRDRSEVYKLTAARLKQGR
jgi:mRNA interferase RelE/StbE